MAATHSAPQSSAGTALRAEVHLPQGPARGTSVEGGYAFKNLPYAAAPVGSRRWRAPDTASAWQGVRDASAFGPSCPQDSMGWNDADAARASEDCLSVNVWTPRLGKTAGYAGLPVMVWVHGGGFAGGSASNEFTDGAKLMRHGAVVVTINYRVGVLGFLAHPDLAREGAHGSSGNYGLQDQLAAFRWVRDNIALFGGDPSNVTAFGQSAGGISVAWLESAHAARGLFHRAILQSGNAFGDGMITDSRARAERAGRQFGNLVELRSLPARDLISRWRAFAAKAPHDRYAQPILDGVLLQEQPAQALLEGAGHDVAVMAGSNAREFASDAGEEQLRTEVIAAFGDQSPKALDFYLPHGRMRAADPLLGNAATQMVADAQFRCGSILSGQAAAVAWVYEFEQPRPGAATTAHSHELLYVFGNEGEWQLAQALSPADLILIDRMQTYWTNFARSGNPNGPGVPDWPRYRRAVDPYLSISAAHTTSHRHLRGEICPLFVQAWSDPAAYPPLNRD